MLNTMKIYILDGLFGFFHGSTFLGHVNLPGEFISDTSSFKEHTYSFIDILGLPERHKNIAKMENPDDQPLKFILAGSYPLTEDSANEQTDYDTRPSSIRTQATEEIHMGRSLALLQ